LRKAETQTTKLSQVYQNLSTSIEMPCKTTDYWEIINCFNSLKNNWISTCNKLKWDPCLSLCTNINSKRIKVLKIKPETEVSAGKTSEYTGTYWHSQ
jgi:hypothetical protein